MTSKAFVYIYLFEVLATYLVRLPSLRLNARTSSPRDRMKMSERIGKEGYLLGFLMIFWFVAAQVLPALHAFTHWFDRFDYSLPLWCRYAGLAVTALFLWILGRSHTDLSRSWSAVVQIKENQKLVTEGIYHFIRHPIYTAHLLWGLAQALLVNNWVAGLPGLITIILIMILRIPREEGVLIGQFGEEYRQYMQKTGALLPKI
jgi:protein-S-isoprenylcysteine O-methyltransferase Ste14